jgi:hypothetical protein
VIRVAIEPAVPTQSALPWPTPGAATALQMPGDARTRCAPDRKAERRERMTG